MPLVHGESNRDVPHDVSNPETEFRVGVFWGKIIYRKVEFPQTEKCHRLVFKKKKSKY